MPASSRIRATATPAAPAPEMTTRVPRASRPVSRSAFFSAASATTAVPCWSSWKTGMSSSSLSRSLDLEAARRGDVLEVDAAEARRQPDDGLDDLVDVGGVQADRDASTPPNCLNSTALPSITGIAAAGPMSPRPSTAVPSVTTATVLGTQV